MSSNTKKYIIWDKWAQRSNAQMSNSSKQCNSRPAEESQVIRTLLVLENLQTYESWCEFEIDHSVYWQFC